MTRRNLMEAVKLVGLVLLIVALFVVVAANDGQSLELGLM